MEGIDQRGFISLAIFIVIAYGVLEIATINHDRAATANANLAERARINLFRYHKLAIESGVVDGGYVAMGTWSGVPGELFGHKVVDLRAMVDNRYFAMNLGRDCEGYPDTQDNPLIRAALVKYPREIDAFGSVDDWKGKVAARIAAIPELRLRFVPPNNADAGPILTLEEIDILAVNYEVYTDPEERGYSVGCCDLEMPHTTLAFPAMNIQNLASYAHKAGLACGGAAPMCAAVEVALCPLNDHVTLGPYGIPRAHGFREICPEPLQGQPDEEVYRRAYGVYLRNSCSSMTDPSADNFDTQFFAEDPANPGVTFPQSWRAFSQGVQRHMSDDPNLVITQCGACSGEDDLFEWTDVVGGNDAPILAFLDEVVGLGWVTGPTVGVAGNPTTITVSDAIGNTCTFTLNADQDRVTVATSNGRSFGLRADAVSQPPLIQVMDERTLMPLDLCHPCAYNSQVDVNDQSTWQEAEGVVMRTRCRYQTLFGWGLVGLFPGDQYDGQLELVDPADGSMVSSLPVHIGATGGSPTTLKRCSYHIPDFDVWAFFDIACRMGERGFDPVGVLAVPNPGVNDDGDYYGDEAVCGTPGVFDPGCDEIFATDDGGNDVYDLTEVNLNPGMTAGVDTALGDPILPLVDEDLVDGADDDGDGFIDEDPAVADLETVLATDIAGQKGIHTFSAAMHKWATDPDYQLSDYDRLVRCAVTNECFRRILKIYPLIRHSMTTCDGSCCP